MLDTNTVSHIVRRRSLLARARFEAMRTPYRPCISAITEGEIRYGMAKNPTARAFRLIMEEFLAKIETLPWGTEAATTYGSLRAELRAAGKALEALDMLIAAHAVSAGTILVTSDKSFQHVQQLRGTEDWASDL